MENSPVSMVEPRSATPTPVNKKNPFKFISAALLILVLILSGVIVYQAISKSSSGQLASDEAVNGDEIVEIDFIELANSNVPIALWSISNNDFLQEISIPKSYCETLRDLSEQYVKKKGGAELSENVCQSGQITLATGFLESDEYPYLNTRAIYVRDGENYARFEFDPNFEILHQYDMVQDGADNAITVKINDL